MLTSKIDNIFNGNFDLYFYAIQRSFVINLRRVFSRLQQCVKEPMHYEII